VTAVQPTKENVVKLCADVASLKSRAWGQACAIDTQEQRLSRYRVDLESARLLLEEVRAHERGRVLNGASSCVFVCG
jgi:hypothetical protein